MRRFPVLPSTNVEAANWLLSGYPAEGAAVLAGHQTAGRGQMGNSWHTAAGLNLTLSVIFYPHFLPAIRQFELNQAIALAVRETIAAFSEDTVRIKWPNDILIGKRKICGILIQNSLSGKNLQSSIAGIGINVNQAEFAADLPHAGSLYLLTGRTIDLEAIMQELFAQLEAWYLRLRQGHTPEIRAQYLQHLFRYRESHPYLYPDGSAFSGTIMDVDPTGRLMVATEKGVELFGIKDLAYLL